MTVYDPNENLSSDNILRDFAHEIRTPLNAMIGFSSLIRHELKGNKDLQKICEYNDTVEMATIRLLRICERVLEDAISGVRSIKPEEIDVRELVGNVKSTFEELAKERGIEIRVDFPDNFPRLISDPLLIEQVLSNLVSNAIKFTPKGGSVSIRGEVGINDNAMIFVIRDTGAGIPADIIMQIRRGEEITPAQNAVHKGWGRGLKIAHDICRSLQAELTFAHADTGGTIIMFSLPLVLDTGVPPQSSWGLNMKVFELNSNVLDHWL